MKRLSFRFCRRALLILAILFPIVYLCGGLFFALVGSHGNMVIGESSNVNIEDTSQVYFNQLIKTSRLNRSFTADSYTQISEVDGSLLSLGDKIALIYKGVSGSSSYRFYFNSINNQEPVSLNSIFTISSFIFNQTNPVLSINSIGANTFNGYINLINLTLAYGKGNEPTFDEVLSYFPLNNYDYNIGEMMYFGDSSTSFTKFLFSHPFAKDNFISKLGLGVLDDSAYGFPPFRDMFNWFNDSVMHIESDDDLGVFGLGYAYYAMNVVAVYELVVLVLMVFALPLRITDKFMGEHL